MYPHQAFHRNISRYPRYLWLSVRYFLILIQTKVVDNDHWTEITGIFDATTPVLLTTHRLTKSLHNHLVVWTFGICSGIIEVLQSSIMIDI